MSEVTQPPAQVTPIADASATAAAAPAPNANPAAASAASPDPKDASANPDAAAASSTEQKPTEEKIVPDKYDLKIPDGSLIEPSFLDGIAANAKAQGLSQEEAQAYLDQQSNNLKSYVENRSKQWEEQVKADSELGGDGLNQNVELARRVADRFGSDQLKTELNRSGFGNHPELVRLLSRIGKAMSEDQLVMPNSQGGQAKQSMEDKFYGNSNQQ
jgi:hypothetical protein